MLESLRHGTLLLFSSGFALKLFPRTVARFSAVQAVYQGFLRPDLNLDEIISEFVAVRFTSEGHALFDKEYHLIDKQLFQAIVKGAFQQWPLLEEKISLFLPKDWSIDKLETVTRSIFRCAAFELTCCLETPKQVLISEYLVVAHGFLLDTGPAFINGLLDPLASHLRAIPDDSHPCKV